MRSHPSRRVLRTLLRMRAEYGAYTCCAPASGGAANSSEIEGFALGLVKRADGFVRLRQRGPGIAEFVHDRIAAVAAEIAQRDLDAWRGLAPLVFGQVEHAVDAQHQIAIKARRDDVGDRLLAL